MSKNTLAAVISAVLLGTTMAAHAQEQAQPQESAPSASQPQTTAPNTSTDASGASSGQAPVGTPPSNVDEKSTSGDYYPYSSGTVGDDPAKPDATTVPVQAGKEGDVSSATTTGNWMTADTDGDEQLSKTEIEQAWPTLGGRFDEIDVNGDKKASRDELRTWHESQKTRMDADQPATSPAPTTAPGATTAPEATTAPDATAPAATAPDAHGQSNVPPVTPPPSNDEPATSDPGITKQ